MDAWHNPGRQAAMFLIGMFAFHGCTATAMCDDSVAALSAKLYSSTRSGTNAFIDLYKLAMDGNATALEELSVFERKSKAWELIHRDENGFIQLTRDTPQEEVVFLRSACRSGAAIKANGFPDSQV